MNRDRHTQERTHAIDGLLRGMGRPRGTLTTITLPAMRDGLDLLIEECARRADACAALADKAGTVFWQVLAEDAARARLGGGLRDGFGDSHVPEHEADHVGELFHRGGGARGAA